MNNKDKNKDENPGIYGWALEIENDNSTDETKTENFCCPLCGFQIKACPNCGSDFE